MNIFILEIKNINECTNIKVLRTSPLKIDMMKFVEINNDVFNVQ